jgi:hypothetical protein
MTALVSIAPMDLNLITGFYGDGWLYLVYSDGTVIRKFMAKDIYAWEKVETPEVKNWDVQVPEKAEPSLEKR